MLEIFDLKKTYPNGTVALDGISLRIGNGLFGLLGPNGAGKSTLMRTLATLQSVDEGSVHFNGVDISTDKQGLRRSLGYLPQDFGVYPGMSAQSLLDYFAMLKGIAQAKARKDYVLNLLEKVNLLDARKKAVSKFSGGMRQRFGIAQALIGDPKLIIVDEPTAGLDPVERTRFNNLLSGISQDRVVILSTHIVSDVADLCPDMAILNNGQLVLSGAPAEFTAQLSGKIWQKQIASEDELQSLSHLRILNMSLRGGTPVIRVCHAEQPESSFERADPDLQDVYFNAIS